MAAAVEFHPDAVAEARAAWEWYAERSAKAAIAFLGELDAAIEQISESPRRWAEHRHGTRRYLLRASPS